MNSLGGIYIYIIYGLFSPQSILVIPQVFGLRILKQSFTNQLSIWLREYLPGTLLAEELHLVIVTFTFLEVGST